MIPGLYKAAMEGRTESLIQFSIHEIEGELTHNKNTVLHVAAQFGQLGFVTKILEQCPSLLHKRNLQRETPLHMAAREGKLDIVEALTSRAKEVGSMDLALALLRATNADKDTALHMAVQNEHSDIVSFLASEDREHSYPANMAEETPLYLAVESNNYPMVVAILKNCALRDYSGPDDRTALHEAVLINKYPAIAVELLRWKAELIDKVDARRWTPLHYAAWCGNVEGAQVILNARKPYEQPSELSAILQIPVMAMMVRINRGLLQAFFELVTGQQTVKGKPDTRRWTPLHIAAAQGHVSVMETILSTCPESWEIVDGRGDNILHIAIQHEKEGVIEFICRMSWSILLMNQKNDDGNTPLHFLAASNLTAKKSSLRASGGNWRTFNNKNLRPVDVEMPQVEDELECRHGSARNVASIRDEHDKLKIIEAELKAGKDENKEREKAGERGPIRAGEEAENGTEEAEKKQREKTADGLMIVGSLLATITFAAAFAIPGGYDGNPGSDQGMAILARTASFKTFVITNTIAFIFSLASVYIFATALMVTDEDKQARKHANY